VNGGVKIVMLAPFGIRPKGTLAVRMLPLGQALVRRGHQVTIVAPPVQNPEDAGRRQLLGGVTVLHTPLPRLPGPGGMPEQVALLLKLALAERPELLHLFKPKGFSGLAALLARTLRPRLPLVVDTDDWEGRGGWNDLLPYPPLAKRLFSWQERDLPQRADAVTVASRTLESQVWGFGVPRERVFYLPNGADDRRPMTDDRRPTAANWRQPSVLLYTRFWEFDVRDVAAALAGIVARRPEARLVVVGRGERGEERELLRLAARAGLADSLDYRGWLEPAQIPAVLGAADLALVPADDTLVNRARCSVKLLELMTAGLPVVASRVGQVAEYIEHGQSGWLVPAGDPGGLARGAIRLLEDAELRARLGEGARARAAAFGWDLLAPTAEQAYFHALAR
jgi:glycosyltransferase involved in cell wall biosynthesis